MKHALMHGSGWARGWRGLLAVIALICLGAGTAWAAASAPSASSASSAPSSPPGLQPIPPLTGHVIDAAGALSAPARSALERKLAALEHDKGAQVVALIVPSTAPEDISAYANRVGSAWKLGRKDVGDGLILLVALQDRRARIEVAQTLEGAVPDIAASHIIEDALVPAFRRGDYAGGLNAAVDQIGARIRGEALPPVAAASAHDGAGAGGWRDWRDWLVAALLVIGAALVKALARRRLTGAGGAVVMCVVIGALAGWLTGNPVIAIPSGLLSLLIALFLDARAAAPAGLARVGDPGDSAGAGPIGLPDTRQGWRRWPGGGSRSPKRPDGFKSGGGGNFGGGGASGGW